MTQKPWEHAKHTGSESDPVAARFVASLDYDTRLYKVDIRGSLAHASMLAGIGLISKQELSAIERGLKEIEQEIESAGVTGWTGWKIELEDVHMCIEAALIEKIGDAARKLHTGRSRNDQVALDLALWVDDACTDISQRLDGLMRCFVELARQYAFTDNVDAIITTAAWRAHAIRDYPQMNVRTDNYYGFLWDLMNSSKAAYNQTWSIGVNGVGSHDRSGVLFWGGSGVWAPSGLPLLQGSRMREELLIIRNLDIKEERARSEVEFNYRIEFESVYRQMKETRRDIKDLTPEDKEQEEKTR